MDVWRQVKGERETRIRWQNLGTTAKQLVMVWACAAKTSQSLGEEKYRTNFWYTNNCWAIIW